MVLKMKVYKYELKQLGGTLQIPLHSHAICASVVNDRPYLWLEIIDEEQTYDLEYKMVPTGVDFECPDGWMHIWTFLFHEGSFVLHMYAKVPQAESPLQMIVDQMEAVQATKN